MFYSRVPHWPSSIFIISVFTCRPLIHLKCMSFVICCEAGVCNGSHFPYDHSQGLPRPGEARCFLLRCQSSWLPGPHLRVCTLFQLHLPEGAAATFKNPAFIACETGFCVHRGHLQRFPWSLRSLRPSNSPASGQAFCSA